MQQKKNIIGILGGIASGKSTVAAELAKLGCAVIDADAIAKQFLFDEGVKSRIREMFGGEVFDGNGCIDNQKLAQKVFADSQTVQSINAVIHPLVLQRTQGLIDEYQMQPTVKAIVLDMPLLAEKGWDKKCDKLIFVRCDEKTRLKRAEKKGISENELKKRENFQISLDKKADIAHYSIENDDLSELIRQTGKLFPALIS